MPSARRHTTPGTPVRSLRSARVASATAASSGSPTSIASTCGARAIESTGTVEACGPKQTSGAPNAAFSFAISATSAASVGVVDGNITSVGANADCLSSSISDSVLRSSAVRSTSRS